MCKATPLTVLFTLATISLAGIACSLQCLCKGNCEGRDVCEGDICFARVVVNFSGVIERTWRCFRSIDRSLCNTTSQFHTTTCCESGDFCNCHFFPEIHTTPTEDYTTNMPPFGEFSLPGGQLVESRSCYRSSSESPIIRLCSLISSCHTIIRKDTQGLITYRRGCSKKCKPKNRPHKLRICCSTALCNDQIPMLRNISVPYNGNLSALLPAREPDQKRVNNCAVKIAPSSSEQSTLRSTQLQTVTGSASQVLLMESPAPITSRTTMSDLQLQETSASPKPQNETLFYALTVVMIVLSIIVLLPLVTIFLILCKRHRNLKEQINRRKSKL